MQALEIFRLLQCCILINHFILVWKVTSGHPMLAVDFIFFLIFSIMDSVDKSIKIISCLKSLPLLCLLRNSLQTLLSWIILAS